MAPSATAAVVSALQAAWSRAFAARDADALAALYAEDALFFKAVGLR